MSEKTLPFEAIFETFLKKFKSKMRSYVLFTVFLCFLIMLETVLLALFTPFLLRSYFFAFALAALVLTAFSLFIFILYSGPDKLEKIHKIAQRLYSQFSAQEPHNSAILSKNLQRTSEKLKGEESFFYTPPSFIKITSSFFSKISELLHENDIRELRVILLKKSIQELIKNIKKNPTSPEHHWRLADAYVQLSSLYSDSLKKYQAEKRKLKLETKEAWEAEKRIMGVRAVEELKILCSFSPANSSIHRQLAISYKDLDMPQEEIEEYETLIRLCPDDHEAKFKLGQLYFALGKNALGLQTYEELLKVRHERAERLIETYGSSF